MMHLNFVEAVSSAFDFLAEAGFVRTEASLDVVRYRRADRLSPGDMLPVLPLTRLSDVETIQTTDLPANRPLVLIFGSYT